MDAKIDMLYYNNIDELNIMNPTVVTLGKFDGMHLGHQKLIKRVKEVSKSDSLLSVMFTFDTPPQAKIAGEGSRLILTRQEKMLLAERFGLDVFVECPFDGHLRNMSADEFICGVLLKKVRARAVVAGTDFRFGKNRQGDAAFLKDNAVRFGLSVDIVDKATDGGRDISSTYVREKLADGDINKVNALLGYPFYIMGEVVGGMHIGRSLGFPTINIIPPKEKLLPPNGVYASRTEINGAVYESISNIGVRPTINGRELGVETYILDFSGDLYGRTAIVRLLGFMRPEIKFDSMGELKAQVMSDIQSRRDKR